MAPGSPYLLADGIAAVAIAFSVIGIYIADEVIFRRARRRILEAIGIKLRFPKLMASNKGDASKVQTSKVRRARRRILEAIGIKLRFPGPRLLNTYLNYSSFRSEINKIPKKPVTVLIVCFFIALAWNTENGIGIYQLLISLNSWFVYSPFITVIVLLFICEVLFNSNSISKILHNDGNLTPRLINHLRLKRYEFYFLSVAIVLIYLLLTKTFSYLIYTYPNLSIPRLRFFGTLKSYSHGIPEVYSIPGTFFLSLFYFLPRYRSQKTFYELENEIYGKVDKESQLTVIITEMGGHKYWGHVISIGSILCIRGREYSCDTPPKEHDSENNPQNIERNCCVRWDYVTFIEILT